MNVCMNASLYVCMNAYMYICFLLVCLYVCVYICIYVHIVYTYIHIYIHTKQIKASMVRTCMCINRLKYMRSYIYTDIQTYTHTHMHHLDDAIAICKLAYIHSNIHTHTYAYTQQLDDAIASRKPAYIHSNIHPHVNTHPSWMLLPSASLHTYIHIHMHTHISWMTQSPFASLHINSSNGYKKESKPNLHYIEATMGTRRRVSRICTISTQQ